MIDANMRGDRFIAKVMPQARNDPTSKKTPSNPKRIMALLEYLQSLLPKDQTDGIDPKEAAEMKYNSLKASARRIRQRLFAENPELRGISWKAFGAKYPSLQKKLTLELETIAFKGGINIYYCLDMWCSDRLLFDAFRGSCRTKTQHHLESNNEDSAGSIASISNGTTSSNSICSFEETSDLKSPSPPEFS